MHTKYNCFVDTQDYCLVNFFDAYCTSQQAFFHHFQAQSGGCVLYTTAYYIHRITVCMIDYINISEDESLHNNMMQFERTEIEQCKSQL